MTQPTARVPLLPREEWTDDARECFAFWGEPNAWEEGSRTNIIMTMAQHPKLCMAYSIWGKHFLTQCALPVRQYELIILRVAWRTKSQYEWHNHVGYAFNLGISREEILATKVGSGDPIWNDEDRLVLRAVDELMDGNDICDATWNGLCVYYDKRQMMDLVFNVGHYVMTSWAITAMRMPMEPHCDPIDWDLNTASGKGPGATYKPGEVEDWADKRGYD